jgi:heme/copper-type cytochrome/quinol oxidase subunit 2
MKFDIKNPPEVVAKLMKKQSRRHKRIYKLVKMSKFLVVALVLIVVMFLLVALISAIAAPRMILTLTIWVLPFIISGIALFPILGVLVWNSYLEGEAEKIRMEFVKK